MKIKLLVILTFFTLSSCLLGPKGIFRHGEILEKQYVDTFNFETIEDVIIVDVMVEGKTYKFLLDTGAPTLFSNKITGDFDVIAEDEITDGSNITETVTYISVPSLSIGNITYRNISAMQYEAEFLERFDADGILGANIMAKSVWDFNLETHQITVSNVRNKKITDAVEPVKIKIASTGTPLVTADYFGIVEEDIFVDFGFNGLYALSDKVYQFLEENNKIKSSISGNGEYLETAFATPDTVYRQVILKSLKIGRLQLPDLIAIVNHDEESGMGSEWLKYYRIIIDFPKKKMYFLPNGKEIETKFQSSYGIASKMEDNKMLVSFIWHSSKAFKKGIRVSDRILSVNGINTRDLSLLTEETRAKISALFEDEKDIVLEVKTKNNFITLSKEPLLEE